MNQQILESVQGRYGSYIMPFLWLHGEPKERVKEEILAIKNSGIREFCAECRPFEAFCQEEWWDLFGFILQTAQELEMKVWLLDDKHFPTGYANGALKRPENALLRKVQARCQQVTVAGPCPKAKMLLGARLDAAAQETIVKVVAYPCAGEGEQLDALGARELTGLVQNGVLYWDIPQGVWRVCSVIRTRAILADCPTHIEDPGCYIDMLNPASCRVMIDEIYQPQYDHFEAYFGTTFQGFFSDEPGFLNRMGTSHDTLGVLQDTYPWREDLPKLIAESAGVSQQEIERLLPGLWLDLGEASSLVRMHYMEVVSGLYSQNFCWTLGNWCRRHGVQYIGHVIEDSNAHMRLGYGSGHYFRALDGQDMAGIDIVLAQFLPGVTGGVHRTPIADHGYTDPAFFRYTLPKLAASHAHLQPLKKGRAMCEVFGAFGWAEGLPYMKQMADLMLASGINHFVPHAFSTKTDDPDCPPHFYNGGKNPQYPLFAQLMAYMGRTAHVLYGGVHQADAALFYNAESEWCGGKSQLFQVVARQLTRNLMDFDLVPFDSLAAPETCVNNGRLCLNGEEYASLLISESEVLPYDRLACFAALAKAGLPVYFTETLPRRSAENRDITALLPYFKAVPTSGLAQQLRNLGLASLSVEKGDACELRYYHIRRAEQSVYLFSNEAPEKTLDLWLKLPDSGDFLAYDAWGNRYYRGSAPDGRLHLVLEKANALLVCFGGNIPEDAPPLRFEKDRLPLNPAFNIALKAVGEDHFTPYAAQSGCVDLTAPDRLPNFQGEIRYTTELTVPSDYPVLDLGRVGETAQVWLDGVYLGARVNAPYKFDLSPALAQKPHNKTHSLEVRVINNAAHRNPDYFSSFLWFGPSGLQGDLALCRYEENEKA